jgi:hypothetical protein
VVVFMAEASGEGRYMFGAPLSRITVAVKFGVVRGLF